jgi:hypothetical protein
VKASLPFLAAAGVALVFLACGGGDDPLGSARAEVDGDGYEIEVTLCETGRGGAQPADPLEFRVEGRASLDGGGQALLSARQLPAGDGAGPAQPRLELALSGGGDGQDVVYRASAPARASVDWIPESGDLALSYEGPFVELGREEDGELQGELSFDCSTD